MTEYVNKAYFLLARCHGILHHDLRVVKARRLAGSERVKRQKQLKVMTCYDMYFSYSLVRKVIRKAKCEAAATIDLDKNVLWDLLKRKKEM